jgi:hypothetical protein
VSDLEPARLLAAGRNLARLLADAGAGLPPEHQAALPRAMAEFVRTDLAGMIDGCGSRTRSPCAPGDY